jgi:hypothetical protein
MTAADVLNKLEEVTTIAWFGTFSTTESVTSVAQCL